MEIKLFMDVTDRNFNIFDSLIDSISQYDINSGLAILQANRGNVIIVTSTATEHHTFEYTVTTMTT